MQDKGMWSYHNPVRIVSSTLDSLDQYVNGSNILLVTTPGFVRRGVADRIRQILITKHVTVWEGVKPNPDLVDLDQATIELRDCKFDCVIGLGGGSAIDAAKVLATTLASASVLNLAEYFRQQTNAKWKNRLPLIAIPTTAGTGAEVTPFATVWDHIEHKKYSLSNDFIYPDLALLDADLTLSLSIENTLYPALDTISHALESLWNKNRTAISQAYAIEALRISNNAVSNVNNEALDIDTRRELQEASILAGLAISQTRTAIAHSISYPLTSHHNIPHGLACSFTLPALIEINENNKIFVGRDTIIQKTKNILLSLKLEQHIAKYTSTKNIFALQSEMTTISRLENYQGSPINSLESILQISLEEQKQ